MQKSDEITAFGRLICDTREEIPAELLLDMFACQELKSLAVMTLYQGKVIGYVEFDDGNAAGKFTI